VPPRGGEAERAIPPRNAPDASQPGFRESRETKRPRRRIADPAIVKKRRANLEKARQALAKKQAAGRKAG
jgi:hypothetical protein